ncbi:DUF2156 domain-containing protein [bacterium]|nr:DUF2156 domain-containing protein [bacterium]MBU1994518.1 DUF2156 domain-containing protein [bacterium]
MHKYLEGLNIDVSDYTFVANFIWLSNNSGFYAVINDTFCLFVMSGSELSMLLPPLGKREKVFDAIIECFTIMNENNTTRFYSKIDYVDESMLEGFVDYLEEGTYIYEALQDYIVEKKLVDYVYKTESLINLSGNSYHTKRTEINKFKKSYPDHKIELLDPDVHATQIVSLYSKWVSDRIRYMPKEEADRFLEGIYHEQFAVKRLLKYYKELDVIGIVIYINDELKGFTVGEKINDHTSSVIIEKTDFEVLGCAQFIFREFCKVLFEKYHSEMINVGDDMGFENLKKVKMSYRPERLIPKYTIYQK